jgi:hypothetical protein
VPGLEGQDDRQGLLLGRVRPANSLAPGDWTAQETLPSALTSLGPALAANGYDVLTGWRSESGSSLWRSFAEDPF